MVKVGVESRVFYSQNDQETCLRRPGDKSPGPQVCDGDRPLARHRHYKKLFGNPVLDKIRQKQRPPAGPPEVHVHRTASGGKGGEAT